MVEAASKRLALTAKLVAIVYTIYEVLYHTLWRADTTLTGRVIGYVAIAVSVAVALGVTRTAPRNVVVLGVAYEVLVCLSIEVAQFQALRTSELATGVSWSAAVILFFPMLLPTSPKVTLGGSLLAACMGPLGYYIAQGLGGRTLSDVGVFTSHWLPTFICAFLAWVPATVLHRLGADVKKARLMGSYELLERLGEGGMGEVYKARHTFLARPAAVKLIRPGAENIARLKARFWREAQATALLQSPHTVQLFDFGISREGEFFYVMELLHGIDLDVLVRRFGPLPAPRVAHLLLQICDSLGEAHDAQLVHRDVKPANIYVVKQGLHLDVAKVLDFGLVKSTSDGGDDLQVSASTESKVVGTPAYFPPELAQGQTDIDARTDLYALGCVAYFLLTAKLVFEAPTPMKMAVAHAVHSPVRPSERTGEPLDRGLEDAIMQCLEKDVARRPRSALQLAEMIRRTGLAEQWTPELRLAWWRQNLPGLLRRESRPSFPPKQPGALWVEHAERSLD